MLKSITAVGMQCKTWTGAANVELHFSLTNTNNQKENRKEYGTKQRVTISTPGGICCGSVVSFLTWCKLSNPNTLKTWIIDTNDIRHIEKRMTPIKKTVSSMVDD